MILSRLTTTHSEVGGRRFITLPESIEDVFQVREESKLFGYSNVDDSELYVSLKQLHIPLGAALAYGTNEPGVMAAIGKSFGAREMNIIAFHSFGIG